MSLYGSGFSMDTLMILAGNEKCVHAKEFGVTSEVAAQLTLATVLGDLGSAINATKDVWIRIADGVDLSGTVNLNGTMNVNVKDF